MGSQVARRGKPGARQIGKKWKLTEGQECRKWEGTGREDVFNAGGIGGP
jgi:hypothetical protein